MDPAGLLGFLSPSLLLAHEALCFEGKASSVSEEAGNADSSGQPPSPRPLTGKEGSGFPRSIQALLPAVGNWGASYCLPS